MQSSQHHQNTTSGTFMLIGAFLIWGLSPLYFKSIGSVPPIEIVAHRAIWSFLLLLCILAYKKQVHQFFKVFKTPSTLFLLLFTTLLVSFNWLLYIWAVLNHQLIEASFGYFITPIINILLGIILLKEQISKYHKISLLFTLLGVLTQIFLIGHLPWISLSLAFSFSIYGLIRKKMKVDAIVGLSVETALLLPPSLLYLYYLHTGGTLSFLTSIPLSGLLMFSGFVTALPLLLYIGGTKIIPLSSVGFLQYISPTGQFLLAYFVFREPMELMKWISYIFIWIALIIFIWASSRYRINN